jgi:hypothetical protein
MRRAPEPEHASRSQTRSGAPPGRSSCRMQRDCGATAGLGESSMSTRMAS